MGQRATFPMLTSGSRITQYNMSLIFYYNHQYWYRRIKINQPTHPEHLGRGILLVTLSQ